VRPIEPLRAEQEVPKTSRTEREAETSANCFLDLRDGAARGSAAPRLKPRAPVPKNPPVSKLAAIDTMALSEDGRGISRSVRHLVPLLSAKEEGLRYVTLTTEEGRELLGRVDGEAVTVPAMPKSTREQFGLPSTRQKSVPK
jgi:hypothetical protein